MPSWTDFTTSALAGLDTTDEVYRPTSFWGPGVRRLLADLDERGLEQFKTWPTAGWWFYPRYWALSPETVESLVDRAHEEGVGDRDGWLRSVLSSTREARRDLDVVRLMFNRRRWPGFSVDRHGESEVGEPPQRFRLAGEDGPVWTRPYLNYMLCLAALSRHVTEPPRSFLEIGGGYGVLGEILLTRDPGHRYVDLDIPPLLTVASYYLTTLFGTDRVHVDPVGTNGPAGSSACLPNWAVDTIDGPFDAFVNTYSFQEMEPHVVRHYIDRVSSLGVRYVVSLNSKAGKPRTEEGNSGPGVTEQVTSDSIVEAFEGHGFVVCSRRGAPFLYDSAGELVVLRRD